MICSLPLMVAFGWGCGSGGGGGGSAGGDSDSSSGTDVVDISPVVDTAYGDQGIVRFGSTWSTDAIFASAKTPGGKFLLGGSTIELGHVSQLLLVRFTADGKPDPDFGDGGIEIMPLYDQIRVLDLVPLSDGGTVLTGTAYMYGNVGFVAKVSEQGDLDTSFGEGGMVTWDGDFNGNSAMVVDDDGKLVVMSAQGIAESELRRFGADGSLDESFGSAGVVELPGEPREMLLLPDGKLLALAVDYDDAFVYRLKPSGSLDESFAGGGTYAVPFLAQDLALNPSGDEILLAGGTQLQKLDASGAPVASFGTDGLLDVEVSYSRELVEVEWHASGEIFLVEALGSFPNVIFQNIIRLDAAGAPLTFDNSAFTGFNTSLARRLISDSSGTYLFGAQEITRDTPAQTDTQAAVIGFAPDGTPLSTFGDSGLAIAGSGGAPEVMWDMVPMPDGSIIASGSAGTQGTLVRYADGQQDKSFGTEGFAYDLMTPQFTFLAAEAAGTILALGWHGGLMRFTPSGTWDKSVTFEQLSGTIRDFKLDKQGRILVTGGVVGGAGTPLLARYNKDGSLDASFGGAGEVLGFGFEGGFALSLNLDEDGKILVTGERYPSGDFPGSFIARFNQDGTLDTSFGESGKTFVDGSNYRSRVVSRREGGYLFTTQTAFGNTINLFALDSSGRLDGGFGTGGKTGVEVKGSWMHYLLELGDGRILIAESANQDKYEQIAVWCLMPDGSPDTSFDEDGLFVYPGQGRAVALIPDGDGVLVGGHLFSPKSGTDLMMMRIVP